MYIHITCQYAWVRKVLIPSMRLNVLILLLRTARFRGRHWCPRQKCAGYQRRHLCHRRKWQGLGQGWSRRRKDAVLSVYIYIHMILRFPSVGTWVSKASSKRPCRAAPKSMLTQRPLRKPKIATMRAKLRQKWRRNLGAALKTCPIALSSLKLAFYV